VKKIFVSKLLSQPFSFLKVIFNPPFRMVTLLLLSLPFLFAADFSYDDPSQWGYDCSKSSQSPINIVTESALLSLNTNLNSTTPSGEQPATLELLATVVEVVPSSLTTYLSGSTLLRDKFYLAQFHFHSPSEHTIDGKSYDLEVHYVHRSNSGRLGVMGVLYKVGDESEDLKPIIENLDQLEEVDDEVEIETTILYPTFGGSFWHYSGSLTAPPCTEGVNWFISQKILTLSQSQLSAIKEKLNGGEANSRPTQSLNGRNVYQYVPTSEFTYENPSTWGSLWPLCNGVQQSPINIETELVNWDNSIPSLSFEYNDVEQSEELENTGVTIEVAVSSSVSLGVNLSGAVLLNEKFTLRQFHFHSPSEHKVNGHSFNLEAHFVHASQNNPQARLSVVGYLFSLSDECSDFLEPIIENLDSVQEGGDSTEIEVAFPFADFDDDNYWYYIGSLTTPPCTEIVNWFVYRDSLPICSSQLAKLGLAIEAFPNNRPVQSTNGRKVYTIGSASSVTVSSFVMMVIILCAMFA
jgi:carbonic anhydrase